MPLIKDPQAQPMLKDAVVLDLGDIANEAKRLREQSQAEAQRIIAQAKQEAASLTQGAAAKGHEQGFEQGKTEGIEQGKAEGRDQALAQMSEKIEHLTETWTTLGSQWDGEREQMHREANQSVLDLALALAEKVVNQRIEVNPDVVADQLNAALSCVLSQGDVTVRIDPEDRETLEAALPTIVDSFANVEHVHLSEDNQVGRGGCVISHGQGQVDASIETQLQRIAERLVTT